MKGGVIVRRLTALLIGSVIFSGVLVVIAWKTEHGFFAPGKFFENPELQIISLLYGVYLILLISSVGFIISAVRMRKNKEYHKEIMR